MRKAIFIAVLFCGIFSLKASAQNNEPQNINPQEWYKAQGGYWVGKIDGQTYWYHVQESGEVYRTKDGDNWSLTSPVVGKDMSGNEYYITRDQIAIAPENFNIWNPGTEGREWDKKNGLGYRVAYSWVIWETK